MSDAILIWISAYGPPALFLVTVMSCLGVPVPSSLALLAAGALVASGDLGVLSSTAAALAGAVLGDQLGYGIGRFGGERLARRPSISAAIGRAEDLFRRRGQLGIFFSRWLVSPLGPPMNLAAGMIPMDWRRFTVAGVLGEAVWVVGYMAIGWSFSGSILALADLLADLGWFLAGLAATIALALALLRALRRRGEPPAG